MRIPLMAAAVLLLSLVEGLAVLAQPAASRAVLPVGADAACAARLAERLALGDGEAVLACDPAGRGRAVVALGNPATAADVAVLVPGSDIDLATLDDPARPQHRPMGWARALEAAAGPGTAVVLWVGYPTPQGLGVDAATGRLARAAVPALVGEVAALRSRPGDPPHLTVIGHSYGAVVVALGASQLDADDLVLLGSPGARADDVAALHSGEWRRRGLPATGSHGSRTCSSATPGTGPTRCRRRSARSGCWWEGPSGTRATSGRGRSRWPRSRRS